MFDNAQEKELIKKNIVPNKNEYINISHKLFIIPKRKITCIKAIIIIYSIIFFILNFMHLFSKDVIALDNKLKPVYEDDISFSGYFTTIKSIALYNPKSYAINNSLINIKGTRNTYDIDARRLKDQINLAKNHGIYGLGFYYFWPYDKKCFNAPLDIIIENKQFDLKFLLIQEPALIDENNKQVNNFNVSKFFSDIKKYVIDERYIKFKNKRPIIGINNKDIDEKDINILRQKFRENNLYSQLYSR